MAIKSTRPCRALSRGHCSTAKEHYPSRRLRRCGHSRRPSPLGSWLHGWSFPAAVTEPERIRLLVEL
eukprot:6592155-Pyramimonas_sp.AAC.1